MGLFKIFKKKENAKGTTDSNKKIEDDANKISEEPVADAKIEEKKSKETTLPQKTSSSNDFKQITKLGTELERVKAGVQGFTEIRKSFTERFSRTSEQIGELRSMILERDKTIQEIELKAIKAYDLVDSVHPEKIMTEVQKQDAKVEALKANLEGNESIMDRVMDELKEAKRKIEFFRGVEEIVKLSEEVKKELIEIKKIESKISINTDKVETIYSEIRDKFQDLDAFKSEMQEMKVQVESNTKEVTALKEKMSGLAEKEELNKLIEKVHSYIDALKSLEKKSSLTKDIGQLKTLLDSLR